MAAGLHPKQTTKESMQGYWMRMTDTDTALEVRQTPTPAPEAGQLLVRMHAASLNRGEFVLGHGCMARPVAGRPSAVKAPARWSRSGKP